MIASPYLARVYSQQVGLLWGSENTCCLVSRHAHYANTVLAGTLRNADMLIVDGPPITGRRQVR